VGQDSDPAEQTGSESYPTARAAITIADGFAAGLGDCDVLWSLLCLAGFGAALWRGKQCWPQFSWAEYLITRGSRVYARLWHRWSSNRDDPLPTTGPVIVVCTHTCSADPTFLLAVGRRRLSFLVAHEFYYTHPLISFILDTLHCIPVRRGGHDPFALRRALRRLLDENGVVCLFPEGNLSGVAKGRPSRAKAGAALLALRSRATVIPAFIHGGPRTDQLLYSWLIPTRRAAHIRFGPPLDLSAWFDRPHTRATFEEVRDVIMQHVEATR
jgi:1-acyl-sn-glycerol-3-phosphate acyltransferase